ncbi:hypothetical protein K493DRAFT_317239 [Basidiobolus meristosporus CBS 931.73]|uniref:Uncharacterized protein n=1 Tax=Basidiobolus meristosporus CBS 931.73 TaxID=1314790 RepID=A0A1Y1Y0S0_9FUNG|nr:hypothetical protein K493DRAFT_317239 [Basidiobolus meristosporus CBS 931.73]|eukprot:ORX91495.1 hypothetical protein K493DRAFT_317239 [Basidiobolus meristosporus CBS 931.73]
MKRYNWNCKQKILHLLRQELPNIYQVKPRQERINFRRIRPYVYVLTQAAFCLEIRSPLLESLSETILALIQQTPAVPKNLEDTLQAWGLTELKSRQFVVHLWNVLVEASYQIQGIPACVENLEARVKAKDSQVLDYAYACHLALPFSQYQQDLQGLRDRTKSKPRDGKRVASGFCKQQPPLAKPSTKVDQRRDMIERLVTFRELGNS